MDFREVFFGRDTDRMIKFVVTYWHLVFNIRYDEQDAGQPEGWCVRILKDRQDSR